MTTHRSRCGKRMWYKLGFRVSFRNPISQSGRGGVWGFPIATTLLTFVLILHRRHQRCFKRRWSSSRTRAGERVRDGFPALRSIRCSIKHPGCFIRRAGGGRKTSIVWQNLRSDLRRSTCGKRGNPPEHHMIARAWCDDPNDLVDW